MSAYENIPRDKREYTPTTDVYPTCAELVKPENKVTNITTDNVNLLKGQYIAIGELGRFWGLKWCHPVKCTGYNETINGVILKLNLINGGNFDTNLNDIVNKTHILYVKPNQNNSDLFKNTTGGKRTRTKRSRKTKRKYSKRRRSL